MTIAAGVRCGDGIVVCADTEHTAGEGKYDRPKIFGHGDWLLLSGAGWSDYTKMAFDKLCERLAEARPETQADARRAVERLILNIYQENIATVFRAGEASSPEIHLIVAIRCSNQELALIKTTHTSAILSPLYEAVGVGSNVFEYWAKFFFERPRSMEVAGCFCMFILQEVKSAVPACGGGTMVCFLPTDPSTPRAHTTFLPGGEPLAGFPQTAVNVLLDAADLRELNLSLGIFGKVAENLKGFFRSRPEMRERAKKEKRAISGNYEGEKGQ
jgi:hypothetical protein